MRTFIEWPAWIRVLCQRFVCLRSPSAMVFLFRGSEASTINGNRPSEQTLLDWQCNSATVQDVALVPARDISDGRLHSGFSRCSQGGCCGNPENPEERHWSRPRHGARGRGQRSCMASVWQLGPIYCNEGLETQPVRKEKNMNQTRTLKHPTYQQWHWGGIGAEFPKVQNANC